MTVSLRGAAGLLLAGPLYLTMAQSVSAAPAGKPPAPDVPEIGRAHV